VSSATGAETATPATTSVALFVLDAEAFSTFNSKDPFIQQAVPPTSESSTTTEINGNTTTTSGSGTTTTRYTTTTRWTTTTRPSGTTSTTKPPTTTTTTPPHAHYLKVLSVGVVGNADAVTFQVDNSIYKDKREGDVVSSSWGQIQVLDINSTSKVVTLLHGSETRVLTVGQVVYE
jgi:hypothetical protein